MAYRIRAQLVLEELDEQGQVSTRGSIAFNPEPGETWAEARDLLVAHVAETAPGRLRDHLSDCDSQAV